ncbi:MAG: hypothetical protein ACREI3_13215, partial [Nitrospirales bacterium]
PILLFSYYRLALCEEKEVEAQFREAYREYSRSVPAFFPNRKNSSGTSVELSPASHVERSRQAHFQERPW